MHGFYEFLAVVLDRRRAFHEEKTWDDIKENPSHPSGHGMGPRGTMVDVQHEDGDDDGQRDKDHGEEEILSNQGDDQRGRGDDLGNEKKEDRQGQQNRDAQGDLLPTLRRQIEDQDGQARDQKTRNNQVDGVEQRETSDDEGIGDVWVDLRTAFILLDVVVAHSIDDHPFSTLPVVQLIHMAMHAL